MAAPLLPPLDCSEPVLRAGAQGILRVAVPDGPPRLLITLAKEITDGAGATLPGAEYALDRGSYSLTGGQRRFPRIVAAELPAPNLPNAREVALTLEVPGDFSIYTLSLSGPDVDPFFAERKLRFRLACDDPFDCRPTPLPAAPEAEIPVAINYLAKDYASFRQTLLDFIPTRLPSWTERSEADIGVMLLELFAATADSLSYMQDRVANEAFLSSASQRASVAGHLALLGYELDPGAAAWTWLHAQVHGIDVSLTLPDGLEVTTQPRPVDPSLFDPQHVAEPVVVFATFAAATVHSDLNAIPLYDWDRDGCCLPRGALSAALLGDHPLLRAGDHLLFDDQQGRREIVRLTEPLRVVPPDPVKGSATEPLTFVTWATPLAHDFCAAGTLAHGNLVLATQGSGSNMDELRNITDPEERQAILDEIAAWPGTPQPPCAWRHRLPRPRFRLSNGPAAFLDPHVPQLLAPLGAAIAAPPDGILARKPRGISTLQEVAVDGEPWEERATLLDSGSTDKVFRVEIDDAGDATIVFGDDCFGLRPLETATITARYRVGGGVIGNVAAGTLQTLVTPRADMTVTNPLPARGGRERETAEHARRFAPATFKTPLVAVTTADYQYAAQELVDAAGARPIQRARADFRWTGSWLTVTLAVDPRHVETLEAGLRRELIAYLDGRRLAGYDLEAVRARYVPIELRIELCLRGGFLPGDVMEAVKLALSAGELPGGGQGFFHPDRFTFGEGVPISRLYAAVAAEPGVASAQITRLATLRSARPDAETAANLARGMLVVGADEIVRLDNDRNFPENGLLSIVVKGVG
jgi:hypothetical protein